MRWNARPSAGTSKSNDIHNHSDSGGTSLIQPLSSPTNNTTSLSQSTKEDEIDSNMSSVTDIPDRTRQILEHSGSSDGDVDDDNQNDVGHNGISSYGDQYDEGSDTATGQTIVEERQNYPNAEAESESIPRRSIKQNKQRSSSPNSISNKVGNSDFELNPMATNQRKKKSNSNAIKAKTATSESNPSPLPSLFTSSSGSFLTHAQNVEIDSLKKNEENVVPLSKSASDPGVRLSEVVSPSVTSAHINISNNLPISSCMDSSGNHQYNHDSLINSSIGSSSAAIAPSITAVSSPPSSSSTSTSATVAAAVIEDDDPGLDHALPPDECAGSLTPSNVWRPQNQQSTCEFTHTIKQYSQKRESGCKKAEYSATTVDVHGNRWRLIVYVNGNGRASNHHLSLFLQVSILYF